MGEFTEESSTEDCVPATINTLRSRDEHQPCTMLCDCPPGTVQQMVGPSPGSDGKTLPTHCPAGKVLEQNDGPWITVKHKSTNCLEKGAVKTKIQKFRIKGAMGEVTAIRSKVIRQNTHRRPPTTPNCRRPTADSPPRRPSSRRHTPILVKVVAECLRAVVAECPRILVQVVAESLRAKNSALRLLTWKREDHERISGLVPSTSMNRDTSWFFSFPGIMFII